MALHTSWTKPGSVNSADRIPPPIVGDASKTATERPDWARVIAAASPLGPVPTTTASYRSAISERHRRKVLANGLPHPPGSGLPPFPPRGVTVSVQARANRRRRAIRERVVSQQAQDRRVVAQQAVDEADEPGLAVSR